MLVVRLAVFAILASGPAARAGDLLPPDRPVEEVVDHYLEERLAAEGLGPAPPADDATLIRRLTLDLNGQVLIRAKEPDVTRPTQVELPGSRLEGEPIMLHSNRRYLAQALRLGFRTLHCYGAGSPILCTDERRRFLWCVLDAESAIKRHDDPVRIVPSPGSARPAKPAKSPKANNTPIQPPEAPMTVPIDQTSAGSPTLVPVPWPSTKATWLASMPLPS